MKHFCYITLSGLFLLNLAAQAQTNPKSKLDILLEGEKSSLIEGFQTPPQSAKPQVWWHWMNGNISKEGIRKDLEWLHSVGIGGVQIFDAGLQTPQIVPHRITYMTPEWKSCYAYAVHVADSLGMEVAMTSTPGWSNTGGPWVKPENAMKKLVWVEKTVTGNGKNQSITLPEGFKVSGSFQNVRASGTSTQNDYYADIKVIAVKINSSDMSLSELGTKITTSWGEVKGELLYDNDFSTSVHIPAGKTAWIQYEFDTPREVKSVSVADGRTFSAWRVNRPAVARWLEASEDGVEYRRICDIIHGASALSTAAVPKTTAKFFRVVFASSTRPINVTELVLHTVTKVNHAEEKAGFSCPPDLYRFPTPENSDFVAAADVIDVTGMMDASGTLKWAVPAGKWKIYRFGYSLTGKMNHPASPEATGLEVDKLDPIAVNDYLEHYIATYQEATGGLVGAENGISAMLVDSYEAGVNNWTGRMIEEFEQRRGYSLVPWMPALAGVVIESAEKTDRFLFDFRKTLSEMIADNLYGQIAKTSHKYGLQTYFEAQESARPLLADGMQVKSKADIPMGAMWASVPVMNFRDSGENGKQGDIRESASVAHIYGRSIVAAESLTANGHNDDLAYSFSPENLKPVADLELASGLNRFVIHDSAHQPVDNKRPGNGLQIYGQWFHRHETWASEAKPWIDYLSRSSYMLQQGNNVADVLYYYGEDNNVTGLYTNEQPKVPATANFDYVNSEALVNNIELNGKSLVASSGAEYKILALDPNAQRLTEPVLRKIAELVEAGAVVVGDRPTSSLSLTDDQEVFDSLVRSIWDKDRDNVFAGKSISYVLDEIGIIPDFNADKIDSLRFVHRVTEDADIYWVDNRSKSERIVKAKFRSGAGAPRKWIPETGEVEPVDPAALHFFPGEAYFVVFQKGVEAVAVKNGAQFSPLKTIEGTWRIEFTPAYSDAQFCAQFDELRSFTESDDPEVKYFAGKALYTNTFTMSRKELKKGSIVLDLGGVANMARVWVNGVDMGLLWKAPYTVDITSALRKGENTVEIEVTDLWRNRIIGDRQPGCKEPKTYTSYKFYNEKSKLIPAGLLGPVQLMAQ